MGQHNCTEDVMRKLVYTFLNRTLLTLPTLTGSFNGTGHPIIMLSQLTVTMRLPLTHQVTRGRG